MDAADSPSTSSKVIVQCTDSHDLFDQISGNLESRLPLGNLHWKSPTRPLRSIDKLNVSFTREARTRDSGSNIRRHQIPGLRQTPYVKLLLLRCDDRDNYKDTARKEAREWLKRVGVSPEGKPLAKGQDRHDAFEYIIVHAIVPGTPAAAQLKSAKQIMQQEASDSTDSLNNKSKWSGKSSTTVFDKLRADFGNVTKGSFERVAQLRIMDPGVPASPIKPGDLEELWQDFIEKLKAAILQSFDVRVLQYEDDIRDRESQRSLPGWNFCTFFILKEGLARGFENVGLIEDALTVYDELDAGLDKIVRDQIMTGEADAAGALLPFSQDLKPAIRKALDARGDETLAVSNNIAIPDLDALINLEKQSSPLDNNAIDYQQRILTNQVSALDLRLYMYTRTLRLLFRRARNAVFPGRSRPDTTQYDIGRLSEICGHALEFISFASRALRQDLYAAWGGQQGLSQQELQTQELVIGNMVASWKVSAILQVLEECKISQILSDTLVREPLARPNKGIAIDAARPMSTPLLTKEPLDRHTYLQSPLDYRNSTPLLPSPQPQREAPRIDSRERLALWAAEFLVILRDIVKSVSLDPALLEGALSRESDNTSEDHEKLPQKASGLQSATLKTISTSRPVSRALYKLLTTYAYRCYKFANQMQASRQMMLSLAQMDYSEGQPQTAITWIQQIPDLLDIEAKTSTDLAIFKLYLECLDPEIQPDEYARCCLSILQFSQTKLGSLAIRRAKVQLQDILDKLEKTSPHTQNYDLPFTSLFRVGTLARSIAHKPHHDGFEMTMTLALCYDLHLSIDQEMVLTLQSTTTDDMQSLSLISTSPTELTYALSSVQFVSHMSTLGLCMPRHLHVRLGNLHFLHTFPTTRDSLGIDRSTLALSMTPVMLYPRSDAFSVSATLAATTDLTKPSRVSIRIVAGDTDVSNVSIRIKPATGGFRLNLHAAELKSENEGFRAVPSDGSVIFQIAKLMSRQEAVLEIPFSLDTTYVSVVQIKFETSYKCGDATFTLLADEQVSTFLPIVVNVQDIFQPDATTLRFSAGPAARTPLRILGWNIEDTELYDFCKGSVSQLAVDSFTKLPANWVVRVKARKDINRHDRKVKLTVRYECTDDLITHAARSSLIEELQSSDFAYLRPLLLPHLTRRISRLWSDDDLEAAALTRQFPLFSFEDMQWNEVTSGISLESRIGIESWLRSWHANNADIDISTTAVSTRTLKLLVDIPQPNLIISSNIDIEFGDISQHLRINHPVHATVNFVIVGTVQPGTEIHFEISAPADIWLIGGKKRGIFQPTAPTKKISIILIPQRAGNLLLPVMDIRGRPSHAADPKDSFSCEIEHQNQAQSILIVPGHRMTTVAMEMGQHWLLESRAR